MEEERLLQAVCHRIREETGVIVVACKKDSGDDLSQCRSGVFTGDPSHEQKCFLVQEADTKAF